MNELDKIKNEDYCRMLLHNHRWKYGVFCPFCNSNRCHPFDNHKRYKCNDCRKNFSLILKTIFENTKIPISKWFSAIWYITAYNGLQISSNEISRLLGVTQKTAWLMLYRIKEMIKNKSIEVSLHTIENCEHDYSTWHTINIDADFLKILETEFV